MKRKDSSAVAAFIRRIVLPIAILVVAAPALRGQQTIVSPGPQARAFANESQNPEVAERLFIGPGDLLNIAVFGVPELQQTVRVSEAGDAVLSLVGKMHLGGMTAASAAAAVENEYRNRKMLVDPHVTVLAIEYATEGISVLGEVTKPGVYPLLG